MVMIGTDSHKRTHTVVAVDDVGRRLAEQDGPHQQRRAPGPARWSDAVRCDVVVSRSRTAAT